MQILSNFEVVGGLRVGGTGDQAQVSDQVKLFLNQESAPLFPEFIYAIIQNPISYDACTDTYSYELEYDAADLTGGASVLLSDHILNGILAVRYEVLETYVNAQDAILQADIDQNEYDADEADAALQFNIDLEEAARIESDGVIQDDVDQNEIDSDAADAVLQVNIDTEEASRISADLLLVPRPIIRTALEGAPQNGGIAAQQERLEVSGTVTLGGDCVVVVTSSALAGSPRAYAPSVLTGNSAAQILTAVFDELSLDSDLTDLFEIQTDGVYLQLETLPVLGIYPANDPTLQITIADDTCVGVDSAVSTNQRAGIAGYDGTIPEAIGQACHVGDGTDIDIYEAVHIDPAFWIPISIDKSAVSYNVTQSVYQKLIVSGTSGNEIITITDL